MLRFNDAFLIGAATSAHQVEGNNVHSDFWALEQGPHSPFKEPSGSAVDHYHRFPQDIALLAEAGLNAYRFSIEWARIEPRPGIFDPKEVDHYRQVLACCHAHGLTPVVTLHHFSSPKWLIAEGGWESEATVDRFERYCRYVVTELGSYIPYICTINEANMGLQIARLMREYQIGARRQAAGIQVGSNPESISTAMSTNTFLAPRTPRGDAIVARCHVRAREAVKELAPNIQVGLTLSLYDYQVLPGGEEMARGLWEEDLLHYLPYMEGDDFLGVQNYTRKVIGPDGVQPLSPHAPVTDMGYEYYPESLGGVLGFVARHWPKPILVTENGISTRDDGQRVQFIRRALLSLHDCLSQGIDIRGYFYWSLLDNFEWHLGYAQHFGLIAVDRTNFERRPKESLYFLGRVRTHGLDWDP